MVGQSDSSSDAPLAASVRLRAELDAPAEARAFVRDFCCTAGFPSDFCDTSALLVNELVKNSVIHGRAGPIVEIQQLDGGLRFGIYDANPMLPSQRQPSLESESGRGLLLLDALADTWGIKPHASGGKYVWFDLFVVG